MTRRLRDLIADRGGAALAEFAIVLPVMVLAMIGFAEGLQVMEVQRRVGRAASTIADLTTQSAKLNTAQLNDIFLAGRMVMAPLPADTLGLRLTSYSSDANGDPHQEWVQNGPVPYAGTQGVAPPTGYKLKPNQGGVVIADVSYTYKPMVKWILPTDIKLQRRMLLRPRGADAVAKEP